jgi:hypothetical protein
MSSPIDLEDGSPRTGGFAQVLRSGLIVSHLQKRVCIELHTRGELGSERTEERQAGALTRINIAHVSHFFTGVFQGPASEPKQFITKSRSSVEPIGTKRNSPA